MSVLAAQLQAHEVADGLVVGPMPATPEHLVAVRDTYGATAIVSVQTDEDLESRGMNWALMWRFTMSLGLSSTRVPIEDFDDDALERGLPAAIEAVADMRRAGHRVYLHCTAGMNRSPTVAVAYLVEHGGLDLDQALAQVTAARPCAPIRRALDRWNARRKVR